MWSSSSSSSSKATERDGAVSCEQRKSYLEMVRQTRHASLLTLYGQKYDVYIDRSHWHWMILVKAQHTYGTAEVGYFSLEITTPDLVELERKMFEYSNCDPSTNENLTMCGTISEFLLEDIIAVADSIAKKMERYSLFSNNCQHFCNNFLKCFKFQTYQTTLGKEVTEVLEKQQWELEAEKQAASEILKLFHESDFDDTSGGPDNGSALALAEGQLKAVLAGMLNQYVGAQ